MKKNIFYWSPCLNPVGTVISTINSSLSLIRYSNEFNVSIINTCGEWDKFKNIFEKNNINVIDLNFKFFNLLPKTGFFQSRISYILIFFFSLIPLTLLLKKKKPDFIISHLITSLPIFIFKVLDFKTKLILRISGMPKFNIIRKYYWKICSSKIEIITCPTIELKKKLQILKIFDEKKIFFLPDAVINTNNFRKQIKTKNLFNNIFNKNLKVFIAAGRLTRQKNFAYLIKEFEKFYRENNNYRLVIFGDGEEYFNLNALIKKKKLTESIFLLDRVDNIYRYMKDAEAFILSSKWEEMGFVIIEAAFSNLFIISSNCPNGPSEFLNNGKNGLLFENNKIDALYKSFKKFKSLNNEKKKIDCIKIKKNSMKFSMYRHFQVLSRILNN
jgi:glycosyltransferase involved in cell wall biosynthesis